MLTLSNTELFKVFLQLNCEKKNNNDTYTNKKINIK